MPRFNHALTVALCLSANAAAAQMPSVALDCSFHTVDHGPLLPAVPEIVFTVPDDVPISGGQAIKWSSGGEGGVVRFDPEETKDGQFIKLFAGPGSGDCTASTNPAEGVLEGSNLAKFTPERKTLGN